MNWYERKKNSQRRQGRSKQAAFFRKGDPYAPGAQNAEEGRSVEAAEMLRIRKRTSLGDVFSAYIGLLAEQVKKEMGQLEGMEFELRGEEDLGFRFTDHDEAGDKITFFVDCSFNLAPEYVKVSIKGARGSSNFSDTLRIFMSDPAMKTARRLAGRIKRA